MRKISKRWFIKSSIRFGRLLGVAVAVPYIVPSSAIGKDGSVPPSERIADD